MSGLSGGYNREVMCAAQEGLKQQTYYGPARAEMVGPIGECALERFVLDQHVATKLWALSEQKTSLRWTP